MAVTNETMTTDSGIFQLPITVDGKDNSYLLKTEGRYLEHDIGISVTTPQGGGLNVSSIGGTTDVTATYNSSASKYDIKASNLQVSAQVATSGWLNNTTTITDTDTDDQIVGRMASASVTIGGSATATNPTIARTNTSATGATNIGSGSASTAAPTAGYFVSLQAGAPATSVTLTKSASAGYLASTSQVQGASVTVSSKAGSVYYLPVTSAVPAASTASATISTASQDSTSIALLTSTSSGNTYYTLTANGSGRSKITTAGWIPEGELGLASTTKPYYIKKVTSSKTGDGTATTATASGGTVATVTAPSATVQVTPTGISDGYYTDSTTSDYYIECVANANSGVLSATGGTAVAKTPKIEVSLSEGYNPAAATITINTKSNSATGSSFQNTAATASTTQKIYLKPAAIAGSVTNATSGVISTNPGNVTIATYNQTAPSGKERIDISPTTSTANISGTYFLAIRASAAAGSNTTKAITGSGTATVTGAGYAPTTTTGTITVGGTATAKSAAKNSDPTFIPLPSAALAASCTNATATISQAPGSVTINTASGSLSNKTPVTVPVTTTSSSVTKYYFAINATASSASKTGSITGTANASCGTSGWAKASTTSATGSVSGTASVTVSSKGSSTYYAALPSAAFSKSGAKVSCSTAGWVAAGDLPQNGTISNGSMTAETADPGSSYTNNTSLVLSEGGWLKMTAGYYGATRISLATLVPNGTDIKGHSEYILEGHTAYDNDGTKVTGNIATYTGEYTLTTP